MAQIDVFTFAAAVTALLIAAGLLGAFVINRRLAGFVWWAAAFALLSVWLATVTLRPASPTVWIKWISWGSFLAAASVVAYGLYRGGATGSPVRRILICGTIFLITATGLTMLDARPSHWLLIGPLPTLIFMARSTGLIFRAGAWGYGLATLAGMAATMVLPLLHPAGLSRAFAPPPPPAPALRGAVGPGPGGDAAAIALDPRPPLRGLIDFSPPPGTSPPVEQPLAITLIVIVALLALAIVLVLRDVQAQLELLRERSTTDAMTGLLNRVTFEEEAGALLGEAGAQPTSLILFDIDHFKRINDTSGHAAGDRVIMRLGQLLRETNLVRCTAGRVGGEEFAVILSNSDLGATRIFAEAIRAGFSASDFGDEIGWGVTLSAGIALHESGESLHSLTARADKALYAAKAGGRDRVVVAQSGMGDRLWPTSRTVHA